MGGVKGASVISHLWPHSWRKTLLFKCLPRCSQCDEPCEPTLHNIHCSRAFIVLCGRVVVEERGGGITQLRWEAHSLSVRLVRGGRLNSFLFLPFILQLTLELLFALVPHWKLGPWAKACFYWASPEREVPIYGQTKFCNAESECDWEVKTQMCVC